MRNRTHYWSCSKFADWLRGTPKPGAQTGRGWSDWRKQAQSAHPVRYWLAEEALDEIQNAIWWPVDKIYAVKYYINNRWVTRTHQLTANPRDIKPGDWCDVGNRFLPCLFNELVDFVEVEQAWHHIAWSEEAREKYNPPFYAWGWFRWRTWRCPEAGLEYLRWAADLKVDEDWVPTDDPEYGKPTHQALAAREIMALYDWWKNVYPNRPDPMDASGWSAVCKRRREAGRDLLDLEDRGPEEEDESRKALELCHKIEQEQEDEDTEMLIRLIKIRRSLWT